MFRVLVATVSRDHDPSSEGPHPTLGICYVATNVYSTLSENGNSRVNSGGIIDLSEQGIQARYMEKN